MKLRCSTYVPKYLRKYCKQESQYSRRHTKVSKDFPSDMNLRIGKVQANNNKILVSRTGFKIGTNLKINLDVKSKEVEMVKTAPDVKPR